MFKFVLIAAFVAAASAVDVPFTSCAGWPTPTRVQIPECNTWPCGMGLGDSFTIEFGIRVNQLTAALPTDVTVTNDGVDFTFPLPNGNACYALTDGACPLAAGDYTVQFPVTLHSIPSGRSDIRVQMTDGAGNNVGCALVDAFVQG